MLAGAGKSRRGWQRHTRVLAERIGLPESLTELAMAGHGHKHTARGKREMLEHAMVLVVITTGEARRLGMAPARRGGVVGP